MLEEEENTHKFFAKNINIAQWNLSKLNLEKTGILCKLNLD
jgi:hypothetical protein